MTNIKPFKLTRANIDRVIQKVNTNWCNRGLRKDINERVFENERISMNCALFPDMEHDLFDTYNFRSARGYVIPNEKGEIELDIALYGREWLHGHQAVYLKHVVNGFYIISLKPIDASQVLTEAVRLGMEDKL